MRFSFDCDQLNRMLNYFPVTAVEFEGGTADQYLMDLCKIVNDNFLSGNYQVAYFHCHLIFMSFVYYSVDNAHFFKSLRCEDLMFSLNTYRSKDLDKPSLKHLSSVYHLSLIPEKEIFKIFKGIDIPEEEILKFGKYVSARDDYAHATGKGNISLEKFEGDVELIINAMRQLNKYLEKHIKDHYVEFLLEIKEDDHQTAQFELENFIYRLRLSLENISTLSKMGLSNYRKKSEEFKTNYRIIKNLHATFIELCVYLGYLEPTE